MERVDRRCCGIDVHKKSISVCVLPPVGNRSILIKEEKFRTFRSETIAHMAYQLPRDGDRDGIHRPVLATGLEHS